MPKGRTSYRRKANAKRNMSKRLNNARRSRGASAPKPVSRGYINRRSSQWRSATREAINRNK